MLESQGSTEMEGDDTDCEDMGYSKEMKYSRVRCTGFLLSFVNYRLKHVAPVPKHQTLKVFRRHGSKVPNNLDLNTR
jgi:hypothetical protein